MKAIIFIIIYTLFLFNSIFYHYFFINIKQIVLTKYVSKLSVFH